MKRWHFAGGADSHGCSVSHRVPGSIGQRAYPGRVFPGKKMPGQMGNKKSKAQNLRIVAVESEQGLLLVSGSVPGARGSRVYVYPHATDFIKRVSAAAVSEVGSQTA
jgi:large subunit ribosomal protein L3